MRHREVQMHFLFLVTVLNSLTRAVFISSNMLVAFFILPVKETEPLIESWNTWLFRQNIFKVLHGGEKLILKIIFSPTAKTHPFPTKTLLMSQTLSALQAIL